MDINEKIQHWQHWYRDVYGELHCARVTDHFVEKRQNGITHFFINNNEVLELIYHSVHTAVINGMEEVNKLPDGWVRQGFTTTKVDKNVGLAITGDKVYLTDDLSKPYIKPDYENKDDAIKARKDGEKLYFGQYNYDDSQTHYQKNKEGFE